MVDRLRIKAAEPDPTAPRPPSAHPHRQIARKGVAVLPTLLTLANLLCGATAIFVASQPDRVDLPFNWTPLTVAAVFIFAGLLLDGIDGSIARLTRSLSDLGAQLDSMADMVTFGVAPAFVAVQLVGVRAPFVSNLGDTIFERVALIVAAIYVVCVALRLARFNIELGGDKTDRTSFTGLPAPGAAGTVASLVLLHQHWLYDPNRHWSLDVAAYAMVLIMLPASLAMVSRLRYVHAMNRYVRGHAPFGTIVKAVIVILLLVIRPQESLAVAFVVFSLSAPVSALYRRTLRRKMTRPE